MIVADMLDKNCPLHTQQRLREGCSTTETLNPVILGPKLVGEKHLLIPCTRTGFSSSELVIGGYTVDGRRDVSSG
jgi:hypothetical protein